MNDWQYIILGLIIGFLIGGVSMYEYDKQVINWTLNKIIEEQRFSQEASNLFGDCTLKYVDLKEYVKDINDTLNFCIKDRELLYKTYLGGVEIND